MNSKITAQQLLNVVVDTNKKVTALAAGKNSKVESSEKSKIKCNKNSNLATAMVLLLSVIGISMILSIFVPAMLTTMHIAFSETAWKIIYLSFAVFTLLIAGAAHINTFVRVISIITAITPLAIITILSII